MQNFEKAESGENGGSEENETAVAGEVIETIKKRPGAMVTLIARFCTQGPIPRLPWVHKCPFTAESAPGGAPESCPGPLPRQYPAVRNGRR